MIILQIPRYSFSRYHFSFIIKKSVFITDGGRWGLRGGGGGGGSL